MKKLNITTGIVSVRKNATEQVERLEVVSDPKESKNHLNVICLLPNNYYNEEIYSQGETEKYGNAHLICDAFKVAKETGYTPTMLMEEREELLKNAKFMNDSMLEVIGSDYTLSQIVSQRKVFLSHLKEAREKLAVHIQDPLTKQLDPKSKDYDFIQLLDTLID